MNIVFGPIYPYTFGTWIGVAFWWLLILSVIASFIVAARSGRDDPVKKEDGNGE